MSTPLVLLLCATSAGFYVAAAAVMKLAGGLPFLLLLVPVLATLGTAAWFESQALLGNRFGIVVLAILASEVLITAGTAISLGERYSLRELAGIAMIVAGMVVVCHGEAPEGRAETGAAAAAAAG